MERSVRVLEGLTAYIQNVKFVGVRKIKRLLQHEAEKENRERLRKRGRELWPQMRTQRTCTEAGNANRRERLSTVDLLVKVARFVKEVDNLFIIKSSRSKLVSPRRLTVLPEPSPSARVP
jgi:hypothetical protein